MKKLTLDEYRNLPHSSDVVSGLTRVTSSIPTWDDYVECAEENGFGFAFDVSPCYNNEQDIELVKVEITDA